MLEVSRIAAGIKGLWRIVLLGWLPFVEYYAVLIGQPSAGFAKVNVKVAHHKVDGTALSPAHKTMIHILSGAIRQTGVTVGMKRTETLVSAYSQSKSLGDPLNRQVAELLKLYFIHNFTFSLFHLLTFKILFGLGVQASLIRIGDELAVYPFAQLVASAILALVKAHAECFKLGFVECVG